MPNFLKKVGSALKKQLGGDIPPEAKQAYEEEKKKATIKGAKIAGRKAGLAKGKAMGRGGGLGRQFLKDISVGSANVLKSDPFGMELGEFDVNKAGMIDLFGAAKKQHKRKRGSTKRKVSGGKNITIVVRQPQREKKPKRKKLADVFM